MELWKAVSGFEGIYEISSYGRVKSLSRIIQKGNNTAFLKEKMLKPSMNERYCFVSLGKNHNFRQYSLHRLVASAFIPNPNNLPEVNHIDGNKQNNNVENLEWCDGSYNQLHAVRLGLRKQARRVRCCQTGKIYPSMRCAERDLGFYLGVVSDCIRDNKSYDGYSFELLD